MQNNFQDNIVHNIDKVNAKEFRSTSKQGEYVPSAIQADTMFTFATEIDYICNYLKYAYIPARYCIEDVSYLKIKFDKIAMPMKCFCDIRLHDMNKHLECYGYNGIAFSKQWGLKKKLQPVHYINTASCVREDFTVAFEEMIEMKKNNIQSACNNYVLELLLFMKPYQWDFKYRTTGEIKQKCFTEECEWRFVPEFKGENYQTFLFNERDFNEEYLKELNLCLANDKQYALQFEYEEVKYIIVKDLDAFNTVVKCIEGLGLEQEIEKHLISKIIIWEESRGDF